MAASLEAFTSPWKNGNKNLKKVINLSEQMTKKVGFISLGCDKNRVDLEKMMYKIKNAGFLLVENLDDADIILVNTCAFIAKAREEAINTILDVVMRKNSGLCEKIVVTGCLSERHSDELIEAIPELDKVVKLSENNQIDQILCNLYNIKPPKAKKSNLDRILSQAPHLAYLKIADGCNNCCAYCTIPRIRGRFKSEPLDNLIEEAESLADMGVKELMIVAQDITRYGTDIYGETKLVELLEKLSKIQKIERIRLHYCYPEMIDDKLLSLIESNHKICGYLDIPLQHIDNDILKKMNRRSSEQTILELIKKIQSLKRKIAIRSTFIVGFPGETKKQFKKLCQFLRDYKLDNVGFFAYSREDKTSAAYMDKQIPNFIKQRRLKYIQKLQTKIQNEKNINKLGEVREVLIDRFDEFDGNFYGRDEYNSFDVDFEVQINSDQLEIGKIYKLKLIDYKNQCFVGELI